MTSNIEPPSPISGIDGNAQLLTISIVLFPPEASLFSRSDNQTLMSGNNTSGAVLTRSSILSRKKKNGMDGLWQPGLWNMLATLSRYDIYWHRCSLSSVGLVVISTHVDIVKGTKNKADTRSIVAKSRTFLHFLESASLLEFDLFSRFLGNALRTDLRTDSRTDGRTKPQLASYRVALRNQKAVNTSWLLLGI